MSQNSISIQQNKRAITPSIKQVVEQGFCVGCGACSVKEDRVRIIETELGSYQADLTNLQAFDDKAVTPALDQVCPFSSSRDETEIAHTLYNQVPNFDATVGHYQAVYTGFVNDDDLRSKSSSGGLVTWLLIQLMEQGKIDAVVHASETDRQGELFDYRLSRTLEEVKAGAKSKYYPVTYAEVIKQVKRDKVRVAFVGVPCFVKSIRLLCETDPDLNDVVQYCFSLFCGHLKSKGFAEMIAWQQGVHPDNLSSIDFRVKNQQKAHQYSVQVGYENNQKQLKYKAAAPIRSLIGQDWGLGYFKLKACDWCDDIAGETADITLGDAWLPEYHNDSGGRNILVVRHPDILTILKSGQKRNQITLNKEPVEKVYQSQAGNYRHRHEGLDVRQRKAQSEQTWHPVKRIKAYDYEVPEIRQKIYLLRQEIAEKSHTVFAGAKEANNFNVFLFKMLPLQIKYYYLNRRLAKQTLVYGYQFLQYLIRKFQK
ncbi:MAG: Coenzyme F420 hydrogenase/dehydrogenase, beta subunit C-terminal domain [Thiomicrorhabdus chilensis]|uniref:Coenzyme F420 hydrogenase/dehydrogenase, beta subunit C-terminal domain n=1 Tax=Thiomicrorhabdus chilensis TaxID=63656 RepID=UPI00299D4F4F|nr:Coenzyme F420 hydrogenase/dehydrogenase, beta subunit C-terminal domain [Thiomicrorhabdus chilensis]MDX1347442.1 Coenzyme F420 hydrogenase/dehydrogenase, beta subunit C-terminal domain [Thiomicrorhabdus chilensis]